MAHWRFVTGGLDLAGTSITRFYPVSGTMDQPTVEANVQERARAAYIFKNLFVRVINNSLTAATTFDFRTGGVDGNQSISVPGGATGAFEEAPGVRDDVASGDLINTEMISGGTGTTIQFTVIAYDVEHATGTESIVISSTLFDGVAYNTTEFYPFSGWLVGTATEADVQYRLRVAATFRNMRIFVSAKTNAGAGTLTFRVNGANGNQTVSTTGTGEFEDTTNSDSPGSGALVNYQFANGSGHGGQNQIQTIISCEMEATGLDDDGNPMGARITACGHPGIPQSFGISGFFPLTEGPVSQTVESEQQVTIRDPQDAINYFARVTVYSLDVAAPSFLRVNAADSLLGVSLSGTGEFEDTADRIVLNGGDQVNYSLDTSGATSGALTVSYVGHESRQPLAGGEELADRIVSQGIHRIGAARAY